MAEKNHAVLKELGGIVVCMTEFSILSWYWIVIIRTKGINRDGKGELAITIKFLGPTGLYV